MQIRFLILGVLLVLASTVRAQEIEVKTRTVLREGPSSGTGAIRTIDPPELLVLEAPAPTDNYWNVRTELDEVGWVYANNVRPAGGQQAKAGKFSKSTKEMCPFGDPVLEKGVDFGPTLIVSHAGYKLEHSGTLKIALWVCERVTPEQLGGTLDRDDRFRPDPALPSGQRSELADYKGSGYDRGHLAPAGNQTRDAQMKSETFFLSNMAPQDPSLNRQVWRELEEKARDLAATRSGAYIITGPVFYDPKEKDPTTADGYIDYWTIGNNEVAVPTHFFKVVVTNNSAGVSEATGFLLANKGYPKPYNFASYVVPVDQIEALTDLNLMPSLSAAEDKRLESKAGAMW